MIKIKMYDKKWRIIIGDETWQFENLKELQQNLNIILMIKNKYGRLKC